MELLPDKEMIELRNMDSAAMFSRANNALWWPNAICKACR
jgi:hypothetical protein